MTVIVALLIGAAVAALLGPTVEPSQRLARMQSDRPARQRRSVTTAGAPGRSPIVTSGAAILAVIAIDRLLGMVTAVGVLAIAGAGVARRWRRSPPSGVVSSRDAALFAELLAACLESGAALPAALRLAGSAGTPEMSRVTAEIAAALAAGLSPAAAWQAVADDTVLRPIARVCCRTAMSGAAASAELHRIARRLRERRREEAEQRVARASVWLVLPLGSCFLPAFVLLTVIPIVIGLLPQLH